MSVPEAQTNATLTHFATIRTDHTLAHVIPDTREMERNVKVNLVAFRVFGGISLKSSEKSALASFFIAPWWNVNLLRRWNFLRAVIKWNAMKSVKRASKFARPMHMKSAKVPSDNDTEELIEVNLLNQLSGLQGTKIASVNSACFACYK